MNNHRVLFIGPRSIQIETTSQPQPAAGQLLVRTLISAISPGTEMLVYRDQFPADLPVDAAIPGMGERFAYPLQYGYAVVGEVMAAGVNADESWLGQRVFAFHPHEAFFCATPDQLIPVPDDIPTELAALLPNMETAVNLVLDAAPKLGETVIILGQGIVGLLTTALLARFPLQTLITLDAYPLRRALSEDLGAHHSLDPADPAWANLLTAPSSPPKTDEANPPGADLILELSGNPAALDQAIAWAGYAGRIVIGSWYGQKQASLNLGGGFHRKRLHLTSSQVSTLAPALTGRWTHLRRLDAAWDALRTLADQINTDRLITHRFPIPHAADAYSLIDQQTGETVQVLIDYP
ncbi:MAG: zinc-binding alcohol dehydrogenase [Caldilineaceae bacterium]|nr:zinc-binding alcohol dehydrogenase [Caldilineaceae bacterium]MBP8108842.1 zinc-binding alcohol dehydrogenase [Caldilineaceae bacterium]MBP8122737.1 zinc-binding alcohol dehydrogenase [Caldilineaceae bacterium]MBP9072207.1 zinc-binding alcohol dehydrogenase [Caldilineaceae bacterium]